MRASAESANDLSEMRTFSRGKTLSSALMTKPSSRRRPRARRRSFDLPSSLKLLLIKFSTSFRVIRPNRVARGSFSWRMREKSALVAFARLVAPIPDTLTSKITSEGEVQQSSPTAKHDQYLKPTPASPTVAHPKDISKCYFTSMIYPGRHEKSPNEESPKKISLTVIKPLL